MASTTEEMIKQLYDSQFASQKEQLQMDYETAASDLDAQKAANQKTLDANLTRTAVESQKAAVNNTELQNAYGLSSGTRAQARLAQENQLQADLTALRAAQQNADAETERQRALLAKEYTAAIRQAQAENDLAKAQALYEDAKEAEQQLLAKQEAAANIMADAGSFTRYGDLYGLSADEINYLAAQYAAAHEATDDEDTEDANNSGNSASASQATSYNNVPRSYYDELLKAAGLKNSTANITAAEKASRTKQNAMSLYG